MEVEAILLTLLLLVVTPKWSVQAYQLQTPRPFSTTGKPLQKSYSFNNFLTIKAVLVEKYTFFPLIEFSWHLGSGEMSCFHY